MKRVSLITGVFAVLALAVVAVTSGANVKFRPTRVHAAMDGRQVVPSVSVRATGAFHGTVLLLKKRYVLKWSISYRRLSSLAIATKVRLGTAGHDGTVLLALCAPPTPCHVAAGGQRPIKPAVRRAILGGGAYVEVYTTKHRNGEIRGQIVRGK
ncbi:MAG: CHRD domain-containing protein [Gaiellaceae bacterium]